MGQQLRSRQPRQGQEISGRHPEEGRDWATNENIDVTIKAPFLEQ